DKLPEARQRLEGMLDRKGEEHPETLTSMHDLVKLLKLAGELEEARSLGERLLGLRRRILGAEHADTLTSMNGLVSILMSKGELDAAQALGEEALKLGLRVFGEEHPETLAAQNNLAGGLFYRGAYDQARATAVRTWEVATRVLGVEHTTTLEAMGILALVAEDQEQAETLQRNILAVENRTLGMAHPRTLATMNNLAHTLEALEKHDEATALKETVLEGTLRTLGDEHIHTLVAMTNLAMTLQSQGELERARALSEKSMETKLRVLGEDHPFTLTAMSALAKTCESLGELVQAQTLWETILTGRTRVFGETHRSTLVAMHALSSVLVAQGNLQNALPLQQKLCALASLELGEEADLTQAAREMLAQTLVLAGEAPDEPRDIVKAIDDFWAWWVENRQALEELIASSEMASFATFDEAISRGVYAIHPELRWVIGKGVGGAFELCVTGELNVPLRALAERWRAAAPEADGWSFVAARQPSRGMQLQYAGSVFDPEELKVHFKVDEAHERIHAVFTHPRFADMHEQVYGTVTFLMLNIWFGEDDIMNWMGSIEALPESEVDSELLRPWSEFDAAVEDLKANATGERWVELSGQGQDGPVQVLLNAAVKPLNHLFMDVCVEVHTPWALTGGWTLEGLNELLSVMEDQLLGQLGHQAVLIARESLLFEGPEPRGLHVLYLHVSGMDNSLAQIQAWAERDDHPPVHIEVVSDQEWAILNRWG
ncbi:MAG: tetratricopeptide repeat protein, partial [Myxococcota bacterium]